jgi:uncharacterized Tic20 family protein
VGSYEYILTFTYNTDRFNIVSPSYVKAVLVVNPRELTITVTDASKAFDGTALVAGLWSVGGSLRDGDELIDVMMSGSQTAVGSTASAIIGYRILRGVIDVTDNYLVTRIPGTLTVTAAPAVPVVPGPAAPDPEPADEGGLVDETLIPEPNPPATPPDNPPTQPSIPDTDTPQNPPVIDEPVVPPAWALVNLILSALGFLLAFVILVAFFVGRKEEKEEDERVRNEEYTKSTQRRKRLAVRIVSLIAAVIAIIVFLVTEDMTQPMQMVDLWTIVHAVIFVIQIVLTIVATRKKSDDDTKPLATAQAPAA